MKKLKSSVHLKLLKKSEILKRNLVHDSGHYSSGRTERHISHFENLPFAVLINVQKEQVHSSVIDFLVKYRLILDIEGEGVVQTGFNDLSE